MTTKLELTWIGKDVRPRLEPRILLEDPDLSYHADARTSDVDLFDNRLIFGDNLLALKALEQEFTGQVKCIFIDPPYNTGSAFAHYDDGIEHSLWLSMMLHRLELLRSLLARDGSMWVTVDDTEAHYLKVLCDEVLGRSNFVGNVIWQKKFSPQNDAKWLSDVHDHVLVYAREKTNWHPNKLVNISASEGRRSNTDKDPRGDWASVDYTCNKSRSERPNLYYALVNPNTGETIWPKETAVWRFSEETHRLNMQNDLVYWGKTGTNRVPRFRKFRGDVDPGQVPITLWPHHEAGNTQEARKEALAFNPSDSFSTPKPERLVKRVVELATNPGDLVLDSFAGSGTTGAVAHKMGRRWIMIELGEHCHTHIIPRMKKVVDGTDQGGISKAVEWKGGGGFRYYRLAPSLLEKDKWGNWVISKEYNAAMLAEAMCKLEGFRFAPSETVFWQQGQSTERDFIYTTTQTLGREVFAHLSEEVGPERSLLVCCMKYDIDPNEFPNLTIRKIPNAVLGKCEFGHDDYSLEISNLPQRLGEELDTSPQPSPWKGEGARNGRTARKRRGYAEDAQVASLFGDGNGGEGGTSPQPSPWKGEGV